MYRAADESGLEKLTPWPPPSGGAERLLRESRWERRRRPYTRRQVILTRAAIVLVGGFTAVVFSIEPTSSLWWQAALGSLISLAVSLALSSPYQIGQLLGLRPASPN